MNNRLYRSLDDRVLAGVAGGMAEAYDLDPAIVRLVWALLIVFTGGAFLVIYIVMALVVPVRPFGWSPAAAGSAGMYSASMAPGTPMSTDANTDTSTGATADPTAPPTMSGPIGTPMPGPAGWAPPYRHRRRDSSAPLVIGALLVLFGAYLLIRQFLPVIEIDRFWPLIVVLLGIVLMVTALGRRPR